MMVTGKWKRELNTMIFLVVDGICTSMFLYDFIEAAFMMISVSAILVVIYSLFRKRSVCDKKRDTK
jgi:4-hydroxybenzoate polyprenyltransferase